MEAIEAGADDFESGVGGPEEEDGDGEEERGGTDDAAAPSAADGVGKVEW